MLVRSSKVRSSSILPISLRNVVWAKLGKGEMIVADPIGGTLGIEHLEVEDAVDCHLHVITRDADLFRDVDGGFFERMFISDPVDEWQENMKPRIQRVGILAESLDHVGTLLGHDDGGLGDDYSTSRAKKRTTK